MKALLVLLASALLGAAEPVPAAAPGQAIAAPAGDLQKAPAGEPLKAAPAAGLEKAAPAGEPEQPLPAAEQLQAMALAYVETQALTLAGTYTFKVIKLPLLPKPEAGVLRFEPDHLSKREPSGHFFAVFRASLNGRSLGMLRVDLEGTWTGKLLRAKLSLPRKAVPEPDQLEQTAFQGVPPAGALDAVPEGFRLRNPVAAGHVLLHTDLEGIPVVLVGDTVRLEMSDGALSVAVEALARSQGAVGERVRLELPSTRKVLMAVVKGPGEARAQWAGAK